jgi:hypothetical protein
LSFFVLVIYFLCFFCFVLSFYAAWLRGSLVAGQPGSKAAKNKKQKTKIKITGTKNGELYERRKNG